MKKILTFGVYDFLHLGHVRLFKQCHLFADYLIVAVQDGEFILQHKPEAEILYSTEERVEMLEALRIVDKVVVYHNASPEFLSSLDFDILALGEDHTAERFTVLKNWCLANGKKVVHLKRTSGICSSDIKKRLSDARI
ncbi:adenylyltransferase/cytidyltransferase family protein [Streptococcus sp. zg-86]|uniref:Adenylyltransferase/cytidyltransferase family protein n=1 Tax=Streptococcus zhangguiae TaxID=2664091 RepID=A0A6I4RDI6_9STRE|nr:MULTISPECIES: adenylyltransferase/cytidyltransferase family protein [unclassified Streptococcus]MTB64709.1 adenylyltransferase/cytidyltransferase family protein [Streptococcus sp. zg-86]MTB91543.1 adenylyltransferase/cytidyltransferase family protein [Streptococcus sp. zg-36]MWV56788.1 adenylyltransferase/cytidyltransferase family protein [Streptococcus sp. zg-70]QTH48519.1 adenylyltransferase/cytidyltransferase family protein [Streptococcus sp. zg-86]